MFKRLMSALTGKKDSSDEKHPNATDAATPSEALITAYDTYGREIKITRDDWRNNVFLPNLEQKRDDPDELYRLIVSGLNDGFVADLLPAAERLLEIDPDPERSHAVHGIVLMKQGRIDSAEHTLREGMRKAGETAALLTNLAKVYVERGDEARSHELLQRAVEADPNMENALMWWAAIQREKAGDSGYVASLRGVADLPGSWRAQIWLARHHLEQGQVDQARVLYSTVLAQGRYDASALMMISGDLGRNGQIGLIVELVAPVFDEKRHDPMAGLNLLRAYQELGRPVEGEGLLSRMYALGFAGFKQHLDEFAQAFMQMRRQTEAGTPVNADRLKTTTLSLNQPIWHYGLRQADWLFAAKPAGVPEIGFFALSKIMAGNQHAEEQREDDVGRLTRAIPLYLAEAIHYWTDFAGITYVLVVEDGGPVVSGGETDGQQLFDIVPATMKYFVTGEIGCEGEGDAAQWEIALSLWSCEQRTRIAKEAGAATQAELGGLVLDLEERLLARVGGKRARPLDDFYRHPTKDILPIYLSELGQAFMLTLLANNLVSKAGLWGERAMLDWPLNMALNWPSVEVPKIMYISGLGKAFDYGSVVLAEYRERTLQLLKDADRENSPSARLAPLMWKVFGMGEELEAFISSLPAETDRRYRDWLDRVVG
ncbi:MAG: tetratricopeptide repeat protein [Rhodocyclaceae bacterium]